MKKITLIVAIALIAVSCGDKKETKAVKEKVEAVVEKEEVKAEETSTESTGEATLELSGNDLMKYDKTELKVKAGQKVTLTLTHTGKMAKNVMGHNFVLLKQGTDIAEFAIEAIAAADNDYIPAGDNVLAHTTVIGGGETVTITFDAPAKGTYDFICSFPGHYGMMQGKFIVE